MTNRKFYKTIIQLEVLSEDPIGDMGMDYIIYHVNVGDFSGKFETITQDQELDGLQVAYALMNQDSNPEFFMIDENGDDLKEN